MFTKYDFTHSFVPEAVCLPKEKSNFRLLQFILSLITIIDVHQNICYLPIQLLKI